ncbi:MAG TPA: trigger factor, partial [Isosphaeraceae bacterium]|nr:trigger factor [Isosphaeraceae bacterium]
EENATTAEAEVATEEPKRKLDLEVEISETAPCQKHIKITVPQAEVERQFAESLGDLKKEAQVPGFRPGRAPKSLVQKRFRKEVSGQVKSALLMACMEQLDEDYKLNPITQPNFDVEAISLPDEGPMTFEIDVEVPPDFEVPAYKALTVKRPVKEISEADVEVQMKAFLERYAQIVPRFEGGAELGDYVTADLTFEKDGVVTNSVKELQFRLMPELRFQDGHVENLDKALVGAKPGESREAEVKVGTSSADPALRGQTVKVVFQVQDLKSLRLPEVDAAFLRDIGFDTEDELKQALRDVLQRRVEYQQRQAIRREIVDQLIAEVPFDLPPDLVARQERSTLRRQVEEMKQAGIDSNQIRAREAEVRANAHEQTLRSLKEFFLLAKIADAEDLKVEDSDFELEIATIAARTGESPRRIRS